MIYIFLLVVGFFFTSLMFYLNHRFVGHGKLGKWPLLKYIRKMHLVHHRNDYNDKRNNYLRLPTWSKALFFITFLMISLISVPFAAGYLLYVFYYEWLHYRMHNDDQANGCSRHHFLHHRKSARHNFSGTMPIIDKVFGTYYKKKLDK